MKRATTSFVIIAGLTCSAAAAPLTCEAFGARLWAQTQTDTSLSDKTQFIDSGDAINGIKQYTLAGNAAEDVRIYCGLSNELRMVTLTFDTLNMNRPSVFRTAKALIADMVCTLVKAPMEDCDVVTSQLFDAAVADFKQSSGSEGSARVKLAPNSWRMTLAINRSSTELDLLPNDPDEASTSDKPAMQLEQ